MLFNPEWKKEGHTISLDDFIGWLQTKNPDETYNYLDKCGHCCLGQYMSDRGIKWPMETPDAWGQPYRKVQGEIFGFDKGEIFGFDNIWQCESTLCGSGDDHNPTQKFGDTLKRVITYKEIINA